MIHNFKGCCPAVGREGIILLMSSFKTCSGLYLVLLFCNHLGGCYIISAMIISRLIATTFKTHYAETIPETTPFHAGA